MKILLAVDGSAYTHRMLAYVAAHDELFGRDNEFTAFTAVPPVPPHAASFLQPEALQQYYREEAEKVLKPVQEFARQNGWKLQARYTVGHVADEIAEEAKSGHGLVMMGTHGHSALGSVVMGSVSTKVLSLVKVPVLLVR